MERSRVLAARLVGLGVGVAAVFVLALPTGSAFATGAPSCSTITSIPASPATGVTCTVASESELTSILEQVDSAFASYAHDFETSQAATLPSTTTIEFANGIELTSDLPFVNGPVVIDGQGFSLTSQENGSGVPEFRGLLLYNSTSEAADCGDSKGPGLCGTVPGQNTSGPPIAMTVENLTIADTAARGGNGGDGAGGGAGLGGAIFVGNGVALTLSNDSFSHNLATGGNGGLYTDPTMATGFGGGGGMGGAGGNGDASGDGGGGGLGTGASGGNAGGTVTGGAGIAYGLEAGGWGDSNENLGSCPSGTNAGGSGGGGGGAGGSSGTGRGGGGGGLSAGGDVNATDGNSCGNSGGLYGIGGGGGGGAPGPAWGGLGGGMGFVDSQTTGEPNGFGGGAAGATANSGTPGSYASSDSNQGFGAGNGVNNGTGGNNNATDWMGGGGAGIGGAVFVQTGATVSVTGSLSQSGASVAGGSGACAGSVCAGNGQGYGSAIFLQGDGTAVSGGAYKGESADSSLTFAPAAGQTQTLGDNIVDEATYDSGNLVDGGGTSSPWNIVLNGAGTLDLAGSDRFGTAQLDQGTLVVPTGASLSTSVTINSGATMILAGGMNGNVTLNSGGTLCAGQMPSNFTNNGGTITTNCTTPPTVGISSPANGGSYSVNQTVPTTFHCAAGTNTVLSSCVDSRGSSGNSGSLDTSKAGVFTYSVTATDADGKTATASITYTVTSPCATSPIVVGIAQFSASCLQPSANGDTYSTPGPLTMNGLTFPALPGGAVYVITRATTANPGGSLAVQAPGINISVPLNIGGSDGVTFNLPAFTWNLPAPPAGGVGYATVKTLSMDPTATLKGMKVGGSVTLNMGKDASGSYYTSFVFTVDLPNMFKSGPTGNSAGLTGTASVRVDSAGAHFNGLAVQVSNAYIGSLQVKSACFAYLPAGTSGGASQCPAPAVPATPLGNLTCTNAGGDNWSGSADIVLPTTGAPQLSLYGDVAGGSLNALSAQASNLKIALADDVFLTSVGVSLCLPNSTEPFAIQGNVTLGGIAQPNNTYLVNINGSFRYQDPWQGEPWLLGISGDVSVKGTDVGQGSVDFSGSDYLYFSVSSKMSWANIVTLGGYVEGWLETASPYQFNVQGTVGLDITNIGNFTGSAAVSTIGVAACATVGGISYWVPVEDSDWVWYEPWKIHWVEETVNWQAGVGYHWGDSSPSVWATSCDIADYELAAPVGVEASAGHAAASTNGFRVQSAHVPMAVKINGAGSAPIVKIKTPSGRVITPPAAGKVGEKITGIGMLFENKDQHATTVLLTSPAAGAWHVIPVAGSVRVTSIQTARVLPPPEVVGAARSLAGGKVGLGLAYSLPAGEKMTLFASGPHRTQQVIGVAKGTACSGHRSGPGSQLCEHLTFRPTYGPSGRRTIYGAVTNNRGMAVTTVKIGSVMVRFPKASAVRPEIIRRGTRVQIEWLPVLDAAKYAVSVVLGDGRKLSYTTLKTSQTVTAVTRSDRVQVTLWPVMPDGVIGKSAAATLRSGASRTGTSLKPGRKHKPTKRKPKLTNP